MYVQIDVTMDRHKMRLKFTVDGILAVLQPYQQYFRDIQSKKRLCVMEVYC